jgi:hypothetical protein
MKKIFCPKCGMEAIGGSGFWGTPKPYCSLCGWNVALAKEIERKALKQLPWSFLFFGVFFGAVAYLSKTEFALFPFALLSIFIVASAIASWKKLRLLEASYPTAAYQVPLPVVSAGETRTLADRAAVFEHLKNFATPRQVRFKPVPRVISIAFPISVVAGVYWAFLLARTGISMSSDLLVLLGAAIVWSAIAITSIRRAVRDRKLLAEGSLAIAVVTRQYLTGGKNRRSQIQYEFKDAAGRKYGQSVTDDSRTLYEEMETPVFYSPANPEVNVPLATASCELKDV